MNSRARSRWDSKGADGGGGGEANSMRVAEGRKDLEPLPGGNLNEPTFPFPCRSLFKSVLICLGENNAPTQTDRQWTKQTIPALYGEARLKGNNLIGSLLGTNPKMTDHFSLNLPY